MSNWKYLNKHRFNECGPFSSTPADGFNGMFLIEVNGLPVKAMCSDGGGWKHVSVSLCGSELPPSWQIMCKVKDLFFEETDWVIQYHPAKSQYVNTHPGCLHLWMPLNADLPKPPIEFV